VSKLWIQIEHPCPAGVCWRNYFRKEKSWYEDAAFTLASNVNKTKPIVATRTVRNHLV